MLQYVYYRSQVKSRQVIKGLFAKASIVMAQGICKLERVLILAGTGKSTKGIFAFVFFRLLCFTGEKEKKENVIGN